MKADQPDPPDPSDPPDQSRKTADSEPENQPGVTARDEAAIEPAQHEPSPDPSLAIWIDDLVKTYRAPFTLERVQALRGISFTVRHGEVFGFLGPNGAGKTTTIRTLMGFISATRGRCAIFGHPVPSRAARGRVGFLPEAPYFYDYLTVTELLDLAGRLFGLDRRTRKARGAELIDRVGLAGATGLSLKKFSKGMLQRAGIAQALIGAPDLVVLDEPLSGLDPVGRKEVLDIIRSLREQGKTVFFSSHILTDVEHVSDRFAILARGTIRASGALSALVGGAARRIDVRLRLPGAEAAADADAAAAALREGTIAPVDTRPAGPGELVVSLPAGSDVDAYLARARDRHARVIAVIPRYPTLEELFLHHTRPAGQARAGEAGKEAP